MATRPLKPDSDVTEVLELFTEVAEHPDNMQVAVGLLRELDSPLRWPMLYASEYYIREVRHKSDTWKNAWKQFVQGVVLFEGRASFDEAEPLLRHAADNVFLPACAILGDLYLNKGLWDKAMQAVLPASEAGYPPAMHQHAYYIYLSTLGKLFQYRAMSEAFRLFSGAAEKGYPPAMSTLGEIYLYGYGAAVTPDLSTALVYLEQAYEAGENRCLPLLRRARAAAGKRPSEN